MTTVMPFSRLCRCGQRKHRLAGLVVKRASRLVAEQKFRVFGKRAGYCDALLLAARKLGRKKFDMRPASPTSASSCAGAKPMRAQAVPQALHFQSQSGWE